MIYIEIGEKEMKEEWIGTVYVVISAVAFGFMAIFAKFAYTENIGVNLLLFLRFSIAAVILWGMVFYKKLNVRLSFRISIYLILMGVLGYTAQAKLFFSSLETISASMAALLLYAYPALVTIFAFILKIENVTSQQVAALLFSGIGLIMVLGFSFEQFSLIGASLAFSAAVVYSIYIIAGNRIKEKVHPLVMSAYIVASSAFVYGLMLLWEGNYSIHLSAKGWFFAFLIAVVSTVIAIYAFFLGLERLAPSKASIISTFEPVVTILAAMLLFHEKLTISQWIGGTFILASVIFLNWKKSD